MTSPLRQQALGPLAVRTVRVKTSKPLSQVTMLDMVRDRFGVSERRGCRVLGQHRASQRRVLRGREDEERLAADIIGLARHYGRWGVGVRS